MFEQPWAWDVELLYDLNVRLARPELDQFWQTISRLHKEPIVLYLILPASLLWLFSIYKVHLLKLIFFVGLAVGLSDTLCYRVIKRFIHRPRPFENPEIADWLRKVGEAHGPSFPSNHAANCFAAAFILSFYFKRQRYFFYTFALLVALSRPALGVHYPSDAFAGALIGIFVALVIRSFVLQQSVRFSLPLIVSDKDTQKSDWRSRTGHDLKD